MDRQVDRVNRVNRVDRVLADQTLIPRPPGARRMPKPPTAALDRAG